MPVIASWACGLPAFRHQPFPLSARSRARHAGTLRLCKVGNRFRPFPLLEPQIGYFAPYPLGQPLKHALAFRVPIVGHLPGQKRIQLLDDPLQAHSPVAPRDLSRPLLKLVHALGAIPRRPPDSGISFAHTGCDWQPPPSSDAISSCLCSPIHAPRSPAVIPSIPGATLFAFTRWYARFRFPHPHTLSISSLARARSRLDAVDPCHSSRAAAPVPPAPPAPWRTSPPSPQRLSWYHVPCCRCTPIESPRLLPALEDSALHQRPR